jgi:hypothetical protein
MPYTTPLGEFDLDTPDDSLSTIVQTNHDRPPLGSFVFGPAYDGTVFAIVDNALFFCLPKQPEHWPQLNSVQVSTPQFPGVMGLLHNGQAYYLTAVEIFYVQGTGSGTFLPIAMKAKTGAQSPEGAVSVDGTGIFHTGPDGIYLFANGSDRKVTEATLEPLFRGEDVNDMPGVSSMATSWLTVFKNHLYFGYQDEDHDYPTNVLKMSLDTNRVEYYTYNDGSDVEIRTTVIDHTNKRLLIGDNTGFVRVIESPSYTTDSDVAISWELQSKDYNLGIRKHFPRWLKYDVDASSATGVTGKLLLDGTVFHTHTIAGNRNTKRRLVGVGNGNRATIRISGSGPVTVYGAELE